MKHLEHLTTVDRAKLLHELRPEPIKDFLDFAKGLISYTQAHQKELAQSWNSFFGFNEWLYLAKDIEKRIDRHGNQLCKSSRLFSDQLFSDVSALWSADALLKFVEEPDFKNASFKNLAAGLFGASKAGPINFEQRFQQLTKEAVNFIHQTVEASTKIVLQEDTSGTEERTGCTISLPISPDPVTILEMELSDSDIVIKGIINRIKQPKHLSIKLQYIDGPSTLYIADYLSKRVAS